MNSFINNRGVSIVICCYNSADRLPETLQHLYKQKFDYYLPWEIIIVDNASTDNTVEVAQNYKQAHDCPVEFSIVSEPIAGLNQARQKGIFTAKYEYILFVDDDNWLDGNYVSNVYQIMEADSSIGALGGQSTAVCEVDPPRWFDNLKASYAVGKQAPASGDVTSRGYLWGAGLVIRKSIWQQLNSMNFKTLLADRKGKAISSGGDGEICAAIRLLSYRLYYDERLKFKHFITKGRLTWSYYKSLLRSFGQARVYLDLYDVMLQKQAGKMHIPSDKVWHFYWQRDIKLIMKDKKKLFIFLFKNTDNLTSMIDLEMRYARIKELWKIRNSYKRLLKQTEKTFKPTLAAVINND